MTTDPVMRVVHDPLPTVGGSRCMAWVLRSICWLPKGHDGEHVTLPRMPRTDVTDDNPRYETRTA